MDQHGFDCHVLTLKEYDDIPNDHGLLDEVPDSVAIHRAPIVDPWRRYQGIKKKHAGKDWFKVINRIVSLGLRFVTFPDHMVFWVPFAARKASAVIRKEGIDTVLVSSPPDSSQLIGWWLKKRLGIRWVADFRDPIYGNVAQVNLINPTNVLDKIHKKLLLKYERLIITSADFLVANTETHAAVLRGKGLTNVMAIRNSFDPKDFEIVQAEKFRDLTIAHVGSIYGNRNPDLLFDAIRALAGEYDQGPLRLKVVFIGLGGSSLQAKIEQYGVGQYVKIRDQVPHHEAIELMVRSHLLLLIKATGKWSKGQIPGKFFEYIGSGNPILCVGPRDSEVAELIESQGLGHVVEDNRDELLAILRLTYRQFLAEGKIDGLSQEHIQPFGAQAMVKKMNCVLREQT